MSNQIHWSRLFFGVFILLILSLAYSCEQRKKLQKQERKIEQLQTTAHDLRDAKRFAQSRTEGLNSVERHQILWVTRAVLSETKDPAEMLLIANVIRNRVDLDYRGRQTAKEVVLDPYQFSAFNPGRERRWRYINMSAKHVPPSLWRRAWQASRFAMTAPRDLLPFRDRCINHFVHPSGLVNAPGWTYRMEQVDLGTVQRPNVAFFRQNRTSQC